MFLTDAQVAIYLQHKGIKCLYCGASGTVEGGAVEIDDGEARQRVGCSACNHSWSDIYTLAGVRVEEV
jgi:transposase-like protein